MNRIPWSIEGAFLSHSPLRPKARTRGTRQCQALVPLRPLAISRGPAFRFARWPDGRQGPTQDD